MSNNLKVKVYSFSYKKSGIPIDDSGNGGGFVFDCRGVLNPGRIEQYKTQNGIDVPVREYLEAETLMPTFIENVKAIVSISLDDYIARGFKNLQISFGCTGGQHRSVYAADVIGKWINEQYKIEVDVEHVEQGISESLFSK
jgi:RNase adaptor protein for sRNA GlmZ degradation